MVAAIGPNFGNELAHAGIIGVPISWTPEGEINYGPGVTDEQKAAVVAVVAAHDASKPNPTSAYAALIAAGCEIVSTGTSALSGTYACDDQSRSDLQGLVLDSNITGAFPTGATFPFPDTSGATHTVTPAQLQAIGAAMAGYIVQLKSARAAALAGGSWSPPAQPMTIT